MRNDAPDIFHSPKAFICAVTSVNDTSIIRYYAGNCKVNGAFPQGSSI